MDQGCASLLYKTVASGRRRTRTSLSVISNAASWNSSQRPSSSGGLGLSPLLPLTGATLRESGLGADSRMAVSRRAPLHRETPWAARKRRAQSGCVDSRPCTVSSLGRAKEKSPERVCRL